MAAAMWGTRSLCPVAAVTMRGAAQKRRVLSACRLGRCGAGMAFTSGAARVYYSRLGAAFGMSWCPLFRFRGDRTDAGLVGTQHGQRQFLPKGFQGQGRFPLRHRLAEFGRRPAVETSQHQFGGVQDES